MKKIFLIIIYNLIIVIILLLVFEFSIRLTIPQIKLSGTSKSLIIDSLYLDSPGIVSNSHGYSNSVMKYVNNFGGWKYHKQLSNKLYKWLILGDSVTMGIGIQDDSTFIGIVDKLETNVNLINLSLIGYSSKDYLNVVKSIVIDNERNLKFNKILIFWTLNDTYSNYPSDKTPGFSSKNIFYPIINFLRNNSKAYHFLKNLFNDRSKDYYNFDRQFYSFKDSSLENSVNSLKFIATLCKSKKISCYLFMLPYEYQIRNFNKKNIFAPQDTLIKLMKDSKVNIIDCKNAFINYEKESRDLYLYGDGIHFSELGHKVLANYVEEKIIKIKAQPNTKSIPNFFKR